MHTENPSQLHGECGVVLTLVDTTAQGKFFSPDQLSSMQRNAFLGSLSTLLGPGAGDSEMFNFNVVVVASRPLDPAPCPRPQGEVEANVAESDAPAATVVDAGHDGRHGAVEAVEDVPAVDEEPLERMDDSPLVHGDAQEEQEEHHLASCEMETGDCELAEEKRVDCAAPEPVGAPEPMRVSEPDNHESFAPAEIAVEKKRARKRANGETGPKPRKERKAERPAPVDGSVDALLAAMATRARPSDPSWSALVERVRDWSKLPADGDVKLPARLCAAGTRVMGESDFKDIANDSFELANRACNGVNMVPRKFTRVLAEYAAAVYSAYETAFHAVLKTALDRADWAADNTRLRNNYFDTEFLETLKGVIGMETKASSIAKSMALSFVRRALLQSVAPARFGDRCNFDVAATILLMLLDSDMFMSYAVPDCVVAHQDIKNLGAVARVLLEGLSNTYIYSVKDSSDTTRYLERDAFFRGCVEANGMLESIVSISWTISENIKSHLVTNDSNGEPIDTWRTNPRLRENPSLCGDMFMSELMSRIKRPWLDADELGVDASACDCIIGEPQKIRADARLAHKKHFFPKDVASKPHSKQLVALQFLYNVSRVKGTPRLPFSQKEAAVVGARLSELILRIRLATPEAEVKFEGVFGSPSVFTGELETR